MKKATLIFALITFCFLAQAQTTKKPLTHEEILKWERITEQHISNDGKIIVYKKEPWKGDPTLIITSSKGEELASIKCGTNAEITSDSKFVVFTLLPATDTIRQLKLQKAKKEEMPGNQLGIYNIKDKSLETIDKLKSVKVPEKWAGWIAWQTEAPKDTTQNKTKPGNGKKQKDGEETFPLFIRNLKTGETTEIPAVSDYIFAEEKEVLAYISEENDENLEPGIYVNQLPKNNQQKITEGKGKFKQLSIYKNGDKVAYLGDFSVEKKKEENYNLYFWNGTGQAEKVVNNEIPAFPENWKISDNGNLSFSDNGNRVFFGTAPERPAKDTTVLEEEIPVLDVWTWNEEVMHTEQLNNLQRDLKKTYLAVFDTDSKKAVQLETKQFTGIRQIDKGDADKLVAWSNHPYAVQAMWEGSPEHNDFYLIDIHTGKAEMIKKDCRATPRVSPEGKYLYWYNALDSSWNTYSIDKEQEYKITSPEEIEVADELNDIPNPPDSYRTAGWLENDAAILIYDRYDVWKVDPENRIQPENISQNGREKNISYRLINFEEQPRSRWFGGNEKGIDPEKPLYLTGHNEITRADGYYRLDWNKQKAPKELFSGEYRLNTPQKAKDADVVVFTKENFQTYPNLLVTNLSFKKQEQISDAAPQQKEYLWGTAELISWTSLDGRKLDGMLFKPDNFDPAKKYPMIVNFYEKSSQGLYNYRMPENHRSTIDYHYYTSNGYLVFNPDVYYKTGYPGEDAFNCVMPGVTELIDRGFVEENHVGAQGHSWGGYQVAYLSTRTNLFAAIESGAPVVNMFSAYGGIRWGSGLNRSFQYEHTQSRIGKSIWDAPLRYLENSPLFTLDKIHTPILIMANDDDGAVPWYQGIEFFIGLRRLQKPAWLLNYNEADHWPLKVRDKTDFQIRLSQFFDHYLKDKPMPKWMKEGIPAVNKGVDLGYELENK